MGYSFGDDLFRWIGISPWTDGKSRGLHLPVLFGFLLLIFGVVGASRIYQSRYPKIMSRLIIGCVAFIMIFPFITENLFFLTKFNSTGVSSVAFSKKDSQCNYETEDKTVKIKCQLNLYNYGKEHSITIRPLLDDGFMQFEIEPQTISLVPHNQSNRSMVFYGKIMNRDISSAGGWRNSVGVEIEKDGVKKRFE
ncbi:hypothetical protein SAMN05661091_5828 [Paenibacillus uliginis N3/975]|uniref:Uncharacterized protein n=1 Tax=Paenibacillus uliginis N3/975 TaxID=1313296 RepID=A0A1X7HUR9_9BACL|nr:hypothetical protein [Paenibacillus uliginis]SMF92447.1 hypothetical protein SAMN05661091_5828 [Paenibacillus uliginis N3/975]